MSDRPLPDDELLSSHIDGELTADATARLEQRLAAEPGLRQRLAELRAAVERTGSEVTPLDDVTAHRLRAAAIAAGTTAENITDLATARRRRASWRVQAVSVAAAVAAIALAVPALRAFDFGGDTGDRSSTALPEAAIDLADETATEPGTAELDAAMAPAASTPPEEMLTAETADMPGATGSGPADGSVMSRFVGPDDGFDPLGNSLGEFTDLDAVHDAARAAWAADAAERTEETGIGGVDSEPDNSVAGGTEGADPFMDAYDWLNGFGGCGDVLADLVEAPVPSPIVAVDYALAHVGQQSYTVTLFLLEDGSGVLQVIDTADCTVLEATVLDAAGLDGG